ncbi:peptidase propeptide and YPEB domain protein [Tissierella creatinophila DSM 6911]|uniref:Peptidase propeptide and YPEB domain protein n=2 Tax=Tissierella creatinophila TaxID=79681 RepID=A0A1U7M616_TISCR|nr:peptidase propeptide and YPEB domain protein [Tissierella creatinophila DSM 6911]
MLKKKLFLPLMIVLALALTACTTDNGNVKDDTNTPPVENEKPGDDNSDADVPGEDMGQKYGEIKIKPMEAFDKYMETYPDTMVSKLELDKEMGKYVYQVEGFDAEKEYELKMDPVNGDVLKEDTDSDVIDDGDDDKEEAITKANVEKIEALIDKALNEAGKDANIDQWTLEVKNGKAILEVEIDKEGLDNVEYKYDVETGELVETDE